MLNFFSSRKYLSAFLAAFFLQLWFDISAYSASHKAYALGLFVSLTYPLIAMIPMLLIVDEKTLKGRLKIALTEGVGYSLATAIFMTARDWHQ